MRTPFLLLAAISAFAASNAHAFPELVRHGYFSCVTCHYSPSGGGLPTAYGRELSREILSWPGAGKFKVKEKESGFAHGVFGELPEWLGLGGDARVVRFTQNTAAVESADWIPMQLDFEAAVTWKTLTLVATIGQEFTAKSNPATREIEWNTKWMSRRQYLLWRPIEVLSARFGLFQPMYGLGTAEHTLFIRRGISFLDQGTETHNLELTFTQDPWEVHATAIFGRRRAIDIGTTLRGDLERGEAVNVSYFLPPRSKVGLSYYGGKLPSGTSKTVYGLFGIVGLSERSFIMAELDFADRKPQTGTKVGAVAQYLRADYEFLQGIHGYLVQQYLKSNRSVPESAVISYGLGTQLFPRPHFEIQAELQFREQPNNLSAETETYSTILFHYYL